MMEYWKDGKLECWNDGKVEKWEILHTRKTQPNIPLFHHSIRKTPMKKLITILLFMSSLGVATAQQFGKLDHPKKYTTVVKTNPFMVAWGILPFASEYRFVREVATAKKQSLLFGFSVLGVSPILKFANSTSQGPYHPVIWIRGYRFQFMYKMYLSNDKEAPLGFYTGPYYSYASARYSMRNLQLKDTYIEGTAWHLSWVIGKQKLLGKHFCYDIYTGLGYKEYSLTYHSLTKISGVNLDTSEIPGFDSNFKYCIGFNLGWMF